MAVYGRRRQHVQRRPWQLLRLGSVRDALGVTTKWAKQNVNFDDLIMRFGKLILKTKQFLPEELGESYSPLKINKKFLKVKKS